MLEMRTDLIHRDGEMCSVGIAQSDGRFGWHPYRLQTVGTHDGPIYWRVTRFLGLEVVEWRYGEYGELCKVQRDSTDSPPVVQVVIGMYCTPDFQSRLWYVPPVTSDDGERQGR